MRGGVSMIIDCIDNIMKYEPLLPYLRKGMEAIHGLEELEKGRYEFDGGYFMVQKGVTRPILEGTFEAHKKYIDVQILVEGSEEVAWEDIHKLETVIPYDAQKDTQRLIGEREHVIKITKGMFYAAFPQDGHQPVAHTSKEQSFTKIVLKLPI